MAQSSIDLIVSAVSDVTTSRYLTFIAFTVTLYDWILLMGQEIGLANNSRFSLGKALYLFIRFCSDAGMGLMLYLVGAAFFALVTLLTLCSSCVVFTWAWPFVLMICIIASYWLLVLRLVALYRSKPVMVWALYGGFFLSYSMALVLQIRAQIEFTKTIFYDASLGICATAGSGSMIANIFYAPFLFELFLICMTACRAIVDYRRRRDVSVIPLLYVLYRDGAIFFFAIATARLWNIYIFQMQPLTQTYKGICVMWAAVTVLTTRIYINLCQVANGDAEEEEQLFTGEMIIFGEGSNRTLPRHAQTHIFSSHFVGVDVSTSLVSVTSESSSDTDRV